MTFRNEGNYTCVESQQVESESLSFKKSLRNMAYLVHPPQHRGRNLMLILNGYFDGSGTHADSKVRTLCGFLGELSAWQDLIDRWMVVLGNPEWPNRPRELHMFDCAHGLGDFDGWSYAQRLALVGDCVNVVTDSRIFAVGSGAYTDIFSQIGIDNMILLESERLGQPLDLVFQYCVQQIAHWTKTEWKDEKVGLIFDEDNKPEADTYLDHHRYYKASAKYGAVLAGIGFDSSEQVLPLQAADLLAYGTYQWALKQRFPLDEPDFSAIPAFERMIKNMKADGGIYDLVALRGLLVQIRMRLGLST